MKSHRLLVALGLPALLAIFIVTANLSSAPAAPADVEVGIAPFGQNATEFVGRADQNGGNFISYGYLTRIAGLTDTLLFSDTLNTNETTAHFTFYATSTLTSRAVLTPVFVVDSVGTIIYYYNPAPSASFSISPSFKSGVPILTATVRFQDILNVQAPGQGVATGVGELIHIANAPFTIGGTTYRLGRVGLQERSSTTGEGIRPNPNILQSFVLYAGNTMVTGVPGQASFMPIIFRQSP